LACGDEKVREEPMVAWAALVALVLAIVTVLNTDPSTVLYGAAELAGVFALFALVCATEAWN
jgi:hypothetical protein